MAYQSRFTGARIDELLAIVEAQSSNPREILKNLTGSDIMQKIDASDILSKLSAQDIIDKINQAPGEIVFNRYVKCNRGAGK